MTGNSGQRLTPKTRKPSKARRGQRLTPKTNKLSKAQKGEPVHNCKYPECDLHTSGTSQVWQSLLLTVPFEHA
ncbi:hypothetical protein NW759_016606 [Fusarium solani]|nr:hypothetical protein NW759_016606 [Fusarium solani]